MQFVFEIFLRGSDEPVLEKAPANLRSIEGARFLVEHFATYVPVASITIRAADDGSILERWFWVNGTWRPSGSVGSRQVVGAGWSSVASQFQN
jgi:hypothetical protein